jgi:hypothetical protein
MLLYCICEALMTLIFPFKWLHTYIPILPREQIDYLDSPTPYIMGVLSSYVDYEFLKENYPNHIICDVNTSMIYGNPGCNLPQIEEINLRKKIQFIKKPELYEMEDLRENRNSTEIFHIEDINPNKKISENIQNAFFRIFFKTLKNIEKLYIKQNIFDSKKFLDDIFDEETKEFWDKIINTVSFEYFILSFNYLDSSDTKIFKNIVKLENDESDFYNKEQNVPYNYSMNLLSNINNIFKELEIKAEFYDSKFAKNSNNNNDKIDKKLTGNNSNSKDNKNNLYSINIIIDNGNICNLQEEQGWKFSKSYEDYIEKINKLKYDYDLIIEKITYVNKRLSNEECSLSIGNFNLINNNNNINNSIYSNSNFNNNNNNNLNLNKRRSFNLFNNRKSTAGRLTNNFYNNNVNVNSNANPINKNISINNNINSKDGKKKRSNYSMDFSRDIKSLYFNTKIGIIEENTEINNEDNNNITINQDITKKSSNINNNKEEIKENEENFLQDKTEIDINLSPINNFIHKNHNQINKNINKNNQKQNPKSNKNYINESPISENGKNNLNFIRSSSNKSNFTTGTINFNFAGGVGVGGNKKYLSKTPSRNNILFKDQDENEKNKSFPRISNGMIKNKKFNLYGENGFLNFISEIFEVLNTREICELGFKNLIIKEIKNHNSVINKIHRKMNISK